MSKQGKPDRLKLGFLAAVEVEGRGHVGGLLVTNHNGRPLEFQCTTPVKPDRTQEILYGKSLRPWLLGELIGKTLLARTSIKPDVVFTTDEDILELRNHIDTPVACTSTDKVVRSTEEMNQRLGGRILRFHENHQEDFDFVADKLDQLPSQADLEEPLERVNEALSETVKTVMAR